MRLELLLKTLFPPDFNFTGTPQANIGEINIRIQNFLEKNQHLRKIGAFLFDIDYELKAIPKFLDGLFKDNWRDGKFNDSSHMAAMAFAKYHKQYFSKQTFCKHYSISQEHLHEVVLGDLIARKGIFAKTASYDTLNDYVSTDCLPERDYPMQIIVIDDFTKHDRGYPKVGQTSHGDEIARIINQWIGLPEGHFDKSIYKYDVAKGINQALDQAIQLASANLGRHYVVNLSLGFGDPRLEGATYKLLEAMFKLKNITVCWALSNAKNPEVNNPTYFQPTNMDNFLLSLFAKGKLPENLWFCGNITPEFKITAKKNVKGNVILQMETEILSQSWGEPRDKFLKQVSKRTICVAGQTGNGFDGTSAATAKVSATLFATFNWAGCIGATLPKEVNQVIQECFEKTCRNRVTGFSMEDGKLLEISNKLDHNLGLGVLQVGKLYDSLRSSIEAVDLKQIELRQEDQVIPHDSLFAPGDQKPGYLVMGLNESQKLIEEIDPKPVVTTAVLVKAQDNLIKQPTSLYSSGLYYKKFSLGYLQRHLTLTFHNKKPLSSLGRLY